MGKRALTDANITALAAGLDIEASADPVVPGEVVVPPDAAAEATAEAAAEAATPAAATEVPEPEAPEQAASLSVVSFLQTQVKEKDSEILNLNIELKGLKDKTASIEATHNGLADIVRKAVAGMKVSMGASNVDLSALSAQELLAEYSETADVFMKTFKAGGVAAVDAASSEANPPQVDPRHLARVNAARYVK